MPTSTEVSFKAIPVVGEVEPGDDLAARIEEGLRHRKLTLADGDILVVAQKVVSKAENRYHDLRSVQPSPRAIALSLVTHKDPRLTELILSESLQVVRAARDVLIVRHRLGYVMANAGIDLSNLPPSADHEHVLLLPKDPDQSADRLRAALHRRTGVDCGVVISDSFGRAWRVGTVNIALGSSGVGSLIDLRGQPDRCGRTLERTQVAAADAIAAGAGLVMGEAREGTPVVLVCGWAMHPSSTETSRNLIRSADEDLFL